MHVHDKTTLIIGGTGKTGSRVAKRLAERGRGVRIASRSATLPFDWENRATWAPVLRDVEAVYLAYYPDLAAPGAAENIRPFAKLAAEAGVRTIVLLSGRGEPGVLPSEQAVRESGVPWTILRAAWFCQNFSEGHLLDPVRSGTIAFPAGNVAEPFIDVDDIADVAAAALTEAGHAGKIYELTGPRLLTFADAAREISEASGRDVRYVPIASADYAAALAEHLPGEYVTFLSELFAHVLDGHNAHVTSGVESALGRKPRDFRDYAQTAAKSGVWSV
jgi:uncharacterized protein YbjT (DUF2867 family)